MDNLIFNVKGKSRKIRNIKIMKETKDSRDKDNKQEVRVQVEGTSQESAQRRGTQGHDNEEANGQMKRP